MSILAALSSLALRPLVDGIARTVMQGVELKYTDEAASAVERFFVTRFTDPSKQLRSALSRAADRSWRAVEIALTGESFWSWLTDRGEDKAFRADIRTFLDSNPLQLPSGRDEAFRRTALDQLRAARKTGLIPGDESSSQTAAKQTTDFLRFAAPSAVCEAEWRVMGEIGGALRECRYSALADLVELRPVADHPPLLAVAMRFFFRRAVETNLQLFQGLVYDQVDQVGQALQAGLGGLQDVLENHGKRLEEILGRTEVIHANVLDLKAEQAKQGNRIVEIYDVVVQLREQFQINHRLRPGVSVTIREDRDKRKIQEIHAEFQALSPEEQEREPRTLESLALLELAAGQAKNAFDLLGKVLGLCAAPSDKARIHFGRYLSALESHNYSSALEELKHAVAYEPQRYALFPLSKYTPLRILGVGGFGVTFHCRRVGAGDDVAVKALTQEGLDRDLTNVFAEASTLSKLRHSNIPVLYDLGYANERTQTGPFIAMEFCKGKTLEQHVREHGTLGQDVMLGLARQVAVALQAAHAQRIYHRDVKPPNLMIEEEDGEWKAKLIDFGLAVKRSDALKIATTIARSRGKQEDTEVAGTLDYAPPEQIGREPDDKPVGPYSDIYSFGRLCYFALLGSPSPDDDEKEQLPEGWRMLLRECTANRVVKRPQEIRAIIERLDAMNAASSSFPVVAPLSVNIAVIPAPQVDVSELPALPEDLLVLEGKLKGLQQTVDLVEHGSHPDLRRAWKTLESHTATEGKALLDSLKQRIEEVPSSRDSELCALAPDAPQWAMLVAINAFKRLVEIKQELALLEQDFRKRQEEDFREILSRFLVQSEGEQFPLASWMRLEPLLGARRYVFVGNLRELLQHAEQCYSTICAERVAERLRVESECEEHRQQEEAERLRVENQKEESRRQREQQAEEQRLHLEREREQNCKVLRKRHEHRRTAARQSLRFVLIAFLVFGGCVLIRGAFDRWVVTLLSLTEIKYALGLPDAEIAADRATFEIAVQRDHEAFEDKTQREKKAFADKVQRDHESFLRDAQEEMVLYKAFFSQPDEETAQLYLKGKHTFSQRNSVQAYLSYLVTKRQVELDNSSRINRKFVVGQIRWHKEFKGCTVWNWYYVKANGTQTGGKFPVHQITDLNVFSILSLDVKNCGLDDDVSVDLHWQNGIAGGSGSVLWSGKVRDFDGLARDPPPSFGNVMYHVQFRLEPTTKIPTQPQLLVWSEPNWTEPEWQAPIWVQPTWHCKYAPTRTAYITMLLFPIALILTLKLLKPI